MAHTAFTHIAHRAPRTAHRAPRTQTYSEREAKVKVPKLHARHRKLFDRAGTVVVGLDEDVEVVDVDFRQNLGN